MRSMTGFGYAEGEGALGAYRVYVKSVNHRFLEVALRLPRELVLWEEKISTLVRQHVSRGKVELRVDFEPRDEASMVEVNIPLAQAYLAALRKLSETLALPFEPKVEWFLELGDLVELKQDTGVWVEEWDRFLPTLEKALQAFLAHRKQEGERLREDLERRLAEAEEKVLAIEDKSNAVRDYYYEKLLRRVQEVVPQEKVDQQLLLQEVLFYVTRSDIHEEIVRLKAHMERAKSLLHQDRPLGRELEFLLQEMHREINTIGSKSPCAEISSLVVDVKAILERMWEQVHNVE